MDDTKLLKILEGIDARLSGHDQRFESIDKRFDGIDQRFDNTEQILDFLAKKSLEHEDRIEWLKENMATKDDFRGLSNTLDKLVHLAEKKDQELTMVTHGMRRMQDDDDIDAIKPIVGLA
jgi:archaellum component FlaC